MENIFNIASIKGDLRSKIAIFSKEELDFVKSFNHDNTERALFIMFCAYKIEDDNRFNLTLKGLSEACRGKYSNASYWDNIIYNICNKNVFEVQNFKEGVRYFPTEQTLKLFNENNIVLTINNFKNLIYYYLDYIEDGRYIKCKTCGSIDIKSSNRTIYCRECAKLKRNKTWKYKEKEIIIECAMCNKDFEITPYTKTDLCPDCYSDYRALYKSSKT